ncbi:MAG: 3'-5' exonuclease [Rikenellaceae bacterium]
MYKQNISNDEVNALESIQFEGEIFVVQTEAEQKEAAEYLKSQSVLGFDTENKPTFTKGVPDKISLVQISSKERAYLFRVNKMPLSREVLLVLQSRRITKVGLAIDDDIKRITKVNQKFYPRSFVDLQKIVGGYGIKELGLKKISAIVLNGKISKAQRLSNWNAKTLTEAQMRYAATDAWVCAEIYNILKQNKQNSEQE